MALEEGGLMSGLERFVRGVEGLNAIVGKTVAWLTFGTVIVCFATVYTRYALNTNFTWLQEAYVWQHALAIVLGGAYTMMTGGFVRVDIFYGKMTPKGRAKVDIIGTVIFLFPFLLVLGWAFWRFFLNSYMADEGSQNPGGLPNWWLLKGALLVFIGLTFLQGCALIARSLLVFQGRDEFAGTSSH
jgi:TRAP-type mannitol/chloroaromatic compound transport system permease small subunit